MKATLPSVVGTTLKVQPQPEERPASSPPSSESKDVETKMMQNSFELEI